MKKIALDLDGVVFDTENLFRVYAEIHDVDVFKSDNVIDNSSRIFQKRYSWSEDEKHNFYDKNVFEVLAKGQVMTGCEMVLRKLINKFEIVVITSRSDEEVEYAKDFLNSLGIIHIYNNCSKVDKCKELGIDYIIEDEPTTCIKASENGIKAIYFKNNASSYLTENSNLKNVHNWGEIYKYLMLGDN